MPKLKSFTRPRLSAALLSALLLTSSTGFAADLTLQEVHTLGNLPVSAEAQQAIAHLMGQPISSELLEQVLAELSRYYQSQGYRHAQALLPEQVIQADGSLDVYLANAQLGQIQVCQNPGDTLNPSAVKRLFSGILEMQGQAVNEGELESAILKLTDLGIFNLQGEFTPGAQMLTQDLTLNLTPMQSVAFSTFADNHGTVASGRYRYGVNLNILNLSGNADTLGLFYARSSHRQNNYSLLYQIPVNSHPTVIGATICLTDYELGREYTDLGAEGKSWDASLFITEPLYRTPNHRTNFNGGYRYRKLTDEFTEFDIKFEQHSHAVWGAIDEVYVGEDFSFAGRAQLTIGKLTNDDDFSLYDENIFKILNLNALLSYRLNDELSLNTELEVQYTPDDVDSSEEFVAGGASAVSGFDSNVLAADSGALIKLYPELKPFAGVDFAIRPNFKAAMVKDKYYPRDTLASVGLELAAQYQGLYATLSLDAALGDRPYDDLDDGKVWFEVGFRY
ncbi:MAG: hypothetical protein IAA31_07140 [Candidatus Anaerobiospirillum merdipullorum]|uniref:ShlB/FhaC/HecB family hemolysin secretion/activation protein n=1 Tax=Candidatus Anaerobiospirillum merdipullorum TaxID=2838450 RepID=A0A9E2KQ53_9GAMM|nr:hypothetical protein [Candidatus Anaerobiospirillum merdipullorum]